MLLMFGTSLLISFKYWMNGSENHSAIEHVMNSVGGPRRRIIHFKLLHLLYHPHRLGFYLVLLLISLYTAQTKATLLRKYSNIVFMNSVMSLIITIVYLLMALKKVTELLPLWSIETTLNVFNYLMQQASSELNYMSFYLQ